MSTVIRIIAAPLGAIMRFFYGLVGNYSLAILLFTLFTKIILFPVSLLVQKNSIKMLKMRPELDSLKFRFIDDKDRFLDEQIALYKREKYHPMAGLIPLLIQIPLIFGVVNVVYRPMTHILHIDESIIDMLTTKAVELTGSAFTTAPQLKTLLCVQTESFSSAFDALAFGSSETATAVDTVRGLSMRLFGIDLAAVPSFREGGILLLIPILASLSSLLLSYVQNRANVLQAEEGRLSQWGMSAFLFVFSLYFAFVMPAAVGLYWTFGNLLAIPSLFLVNLVLDPKKYIDYRYLDSMKRLTKAQDEKLKKNSGRSKVDYRRFTAESNQKAMQVVFYSESSGFYKYFRNIIEALLDKSDIVIHYVTNDPDDCVFAINNPRFVPYYVSENRLIPLMMKIEADVVVMTVPDLEKYHIKRSRVREDVEYIFVDHGGTSLNLTYRTGAFDYFDTIFVVNQRQEEECRAIEALRHTKKKRIVHCGYGQIDNMIDAYASMDKVENAKKTILIAPSWQDDNILDSCIDDLLAQLLTGEYRVIVRPHPQYVRRFPINMDTLITRYKDRFSEDFEIQTDFSSNETIYTADLVITDWSAIGVEFSLTTLKPTLFINTPMKVVNPDWQKIDVMPFIIDVRTRIGTSVDPNKPKDAAAAVKELLASPERYKEKILDCREEFLYHPGHSGEVGADYIINRVEQKRHTKLRTKPAYIRVVPRKEDAKPISSEQ